MVYGVALVLNAQIHLGFIGVDRGSAVIVSCHETVHVVRRRSWDGTNASHLAVALLGAKQDGLVAESAHLPALPCVHVGRLPADIGFIGFDRAIQLVVVVLFPCLPQSVEHVPGRLLGDLDVPVQFRLETPLRLVT